MDNLGELKQDLAAANTRMADAERLLVRAIQLNGPGSPAHTQQRLAVVEAYHNLSEVEDAMDLAEE